MVAVSQAKQSSQPVNVKVHLEAQDNMAVMYVSVGGHVLGYQVLQDLSIEEAQQRYVQLCKAIVEGDDVCLS